jgi:hypothetical protein
MSKKPWVKTEILLPKDYDSEDAQTVAEEILNFIVERTKKGYGSDGEKFPGYSPSYKASDAFKLGGKSSKVDLTLSGEMLDSLEVLEAKRGKIVFGYAKDSDMNGRADGNCRGSYGTSKDDPSKARNFMELSGKELAKIIRSLDILPKDIQNQIAKDAKSGAIDIIDNFQFEVDDGEDG